MYLCTQKCVNVHTCTQCEHITYRLLTIVSCKHKCTCVCMCLCVCTACVYLTIYLSVCPFIYLPVCLPVCLFLYTSVCLCMCGASRNYSAYVCVLRYTMDLYVYMQNI